MHAGGAERVAGSLCNYWAKRNIEVILIPTYSKRGNCFYKLDPRIKLVFLADKLKTKKSNYFIKLKRIFLMRSFIKEYKPDVIVSFLTDVNIGAILSNIGSRKPLIISERIHPSLMPLPKYIKLLRFLLYRKADGIVVQTERTQDWFKKNRICSQIKIIPNPIVEFEDEEEFNEQLEQIGKPFILAIGRLNHAKGFDILIKSYAKLAKKKNIPNLVIVGEGEEEENLKKITLECDLSKKIFIMKNHKNIKNFYDNACLFVLSSRLEGFPNVLIEAIANQVPVVAFDCPTGPREILSQYNAGLLIPSDSGIDGLEGAISDVLFKLKYDLLNSSLSIKNAYNIEKIGQKWLNFFDSFIEKK